MNTWRQYRWPLVIAATTLILGGFLLSTAFPLRPSQAPHDARLTSAASEGDEQPSATPEAGQRSAKGRITSATAADFDDLVLRSTVPVIVDFYADWCGPCRIQARILDEFAAEGGDVKIVKVDVDNEAELAQRFEVRALPTLLIIKDGQVVAQHVGVATKEQLSAALAG